MAITRHPALTGKVYRTRNPKRKLRRNGRKRAERERVESQAKTAHEARLAKTRKRHGDFDEVVAAAIPQVEGVHNPGIDAAMDASDSADV
jgi:hypothetical protein